MGFAQTYHDDADADSDPADDVQFAVEHLVDSRRTALTSQEEGGEKKKKREKNLETEDCLCGGRQHNNNRRKAVCVRPVTVVMRISSPSFLGQMSLAASITVPVGPQQFSCNQKDKLVTILVLLGTKKSTDDSQTHWGNCDK